MSEDHSIAKLTEDDNNVEANRGSSVEDDMKPVNSSAIVKYSNIQMPAMFTLLQRDTDIKNPPQNWLHGGSKWESNLLDFCIGKPHNFTSFNMARCFPDVTGEVDLISDSENIKRLLKMAYSKAPVSMMIHRVANTLLLDEFDIHKYLLRKEEEEWKWLRTFFFECVVREKRENKEKLILKKNRSRDHLEYRNMFSKFLYHSLQYKEDSEVPSGPHAGSEARSAHVVSPPRGTSRDDTAVHVTPVPQPSVVAEYQRTVQWTFEDLTMLVGTDLPIFGGGVHPCVSLRLQDMKKPINVLTGIDCWLDSLMCNVPEVAMCYHLDGIVQGYELIKTEDIPNVEGSRFSPQLVKNVATNILAFLKSNATKEGHTYWLFKGNNDEVVKLYDLTSLCCEYMNDGQSNPFTVPAGILLYRVARNMKQRGENSKLDTVRALLENALLLLDDKIHSQVVSSAHLMLADIFVHDVNSVHPVRHTEQSQQVLKAYEPMSRVSVSTLTTPDSVPLTLAPPPPLPASLDERCVAALHHVTLGLQSVAGHQQRAASGRRHLVEEQSVCDPDEAIPLGYTPLSDVTTCGRDLPVCRQAGVAWPELSRGLLLRRAALVCLTWAEHKMAAGTHASALRVARVGLRCYDAFEKIVPSAATDSRHIGSGLLGVAGDQFVLLVAHLDAVDQLTEMYNSHTELEATLYDAVSDDVTDTDYLWMSELSADPVSMLKCGLQAYTLALQKTTEQSDKAETLHKRKGNVHNELGVQLMRQAQSMLELDGLMGTSHNSTSSLIDASDNHFKEALSHFGKATKQDYINLALVYANQAKLCKLSAQYIHADNSEVSQATVREWTKAESYGLKAIESLSKFERLSEVTELLDTFKYDVSRTYFLHASMLQDYPPVTSSSHDQHDVTTLMTRALQHCSVEAPGSARCDVCCDVTCAACRRAVVRQEYVSSVHHRLASLYHHACRVQTQDVRRRQLRTLAERYYSNALRWLPARADPREHLRIHMELVTLSDLPSTGAQGATRMRSLLSSLKVALQCRPALRALLEQRSLPAGGGEEARRLLTLLSDRILTLLLEAVKVRATLKKGTAPSLEALKKVYAAALKGRSSIPSDVNQTAGGLSDCSHDDASPNSSSATPPYITVCRSLLDVLQHLGDLIT